jgi:hypothetical protein
VSKTVTHGAELDKLRAGTVNERWANDMLPTCLNCDYYSHSSCTHDLGSWPNDTPRIIMNTMQFRPLWCPIMKHSHQND